MLAFPLTASPGSAIMAIMIRFLFALGVVAMAGPTAAQSRLPAFDPARIEFATPTTQSSTCLGDRRDARCFVETATVCAFHQTRPFCGDGREFGRVHNSSGGQRIEYQFRKMGLIPFEKLDTLENGIFGDPEAEETHELTKRRAIIAQARIRVAICDLARSGCGNDDEVDLLFYIERRGSIWHLFASALYNDDNWLAE
jgi:hypothetical protein